ncbi:MAG: hypothetical protein AB8B55_19565 [Mariniblastus sp.]
MTSLAESRELENSHELATCKVSLTKVRPRKPPPLKTRLAMCLIKRKLKKYAIETSDSCKSGLREALPEFN